MSKRKLLAGVLAAMMAATCLTGCSTARKSDLDGDMNTIVAATYGDENIYLDEVNYYLRNTQLSYEYYYTMYGMSDVWSDEDSVDSLFEDTLASIYQTKVLNDYAEANDITLTDSEQELVKTTVDSLKDSTAAYMAIAGQDEEMLTDICTENAIANKVYYEIKEATEITTTEDEHTQDAVSYLLFNEASDDSESETASETESADESETEEATYTEDDANAALALLQSGKTIDEVGTEYGIDVETSNFSVNEEQTTEPAATAITLKTGESAVCYEDGVGWYLVYCTSEKDEDATASAYSDAVDQEKTDHFNEVYKDMDKKKFTVIDDIVESLDVANTPVYNIETESETDTETESAEATDTTDGTSLSASESEEETTTAAAE